MKRISPAIVTFGMMAIVLGLVSAYIVRQALQKPPVAVRPAPPPKAVDPGVPVVFAYKSMSKNSRITPRDIFVQMMPKEVRAAQGTIRNFNLVEGRILKQTIRAGQAIRDEYLLPVGEGLPDLAERLPAGHRAVSIAVRGAATGGRRLTEGDLVDISLTVEGTHPDLGEVTTRTLLRKVLIVDAKEDYPKTRGIDRNTSMVRTSEELTVAVLPADANKLIVAQRSGTLGVVLVPTADAVDAESPPEDSINRRQLLGLKEVPPVRKYTMEKWSGGSVSRSEWSEDKIRESREYRSPPVTQPVLTQPVLSQPAVDTRSTYAPSGIVVPVSEIDRESAVAVVSTGEESTSPLGDPEAIKASASAN